jgi:hypothetical protein
LMVGALQSLERNSTASVSSSPLARALCFALISPMDGSLACSLCGQ